MTRKFLIRWLFLFLWISMVRGQHGNEAVSNLECHQEGMVITCGQLKGIVAEPLVVESVKDRFEKRTDGTWLYNPNSIDIPTPHDGPADAYREEASLNYPGIDEVREMMAEAGISSGTPYGMERMFRHLWLKQKEHREQIISLEKKLHDLEATNSGRSAQVPGYSGDIGITRDISGLCIVRGPPCTIAGCGLPLFRSLIACSTTLLACLDDQACNTTTCPATCANGHKGSISYPSY